MNSNYPPPSYRPGVGNLTSQDFDHLSAQPLRGFVVSANLRNACWSYYTMLRYTILPRGCGAYIYIYIYIYIYTYIVYVCVYIYIYIHKSVYCYVHCYHWYYYHVYCNYVGKRGSPRISAALRRTSRATSLSNCKILRLNNCNFAELRNFAKTIATSLNGCKILAREIPQTQGASPGGDYCYYHYHYHYHYYYY